MFKVIDENARGYICLDCDNSSIFHGKFDIYRLYKPIGEKYDFDNEIICPQEMLCYECRSNEIGIETSSNKIIKDHYFNTGHGLWLVGEKSLLNVDSSNDLKNLIKIIVESEGENKSKEFQNQLLHFGLSDWNWSEELFFEYKFSLGLVKILSTGLIRQDEFGLMDEESSYENAKYIGVK